jgi:hypothetical protein
MEANYLNRRRHAVVALMWSGPVIFGFFITFNVGQALYKGYGLFAGNVHPKTAPHAGNGFWIDALVIAGTFVILALLVVGWQWLASRLGDGPDTSLTQEEVDAQPLYIIEIPRYTRALVILGAVCIVVVSIMGAALLPAILLTSGW